MLFCPKYKVNTFESKTSTMSPFTIASYMPFLISYPLNIPLDNNISHTCLNFITTKHFLPENNTIHIISTKHVPLDYNIFFLHLFVPDTCPTDQGYVYFAPENFCVKLNKTKVVYSTTHYYCVLERASIVRVDSIKKLSILQSMLCRCQSD